MYNRADLEVNPFQTIPKIDEAPFRRERTLSKAELLALFDSIDQEEDIYKDCVMMLLLTGQRKTNVLSMRWDEINYETKAWVIPLDKIKTKKAHVVPLSQEAMAILQRRSDNAEQGEVYVFPSPRSKTGYIADKSGIGGFWHRITKRAGLYDPHDPKKHLRIHDLRRTLATYNVSFGGSLQATSKLLGHSNISVTHDVYAHLSIENVRTELEHTTQVMLGSPQRSKLDTLKHEISGLDDESKRDLLSFLQSELIEAVEV
jgi:integrase